MSQPLVSILIPAYNAQQWIGHTIRSAMSQTWRNKEIIMVDDGSTDFTAKLAKSFGVTVISQENRGQSAALNRGIAESRGDYIQFLDADDLLFADKIEKQMAARSSRQDSRVLLSCPWASFFHRPDMATFVSTSLWQDLSPVEWLLRNLGSNVFMPPHSWLVSRELVNAAGLWDETLNYNQDGEYFARVLLHSVGTQFVSNTGVYYRASGTGSVSYIGQSMSKKNSMLRSMRLHMGYLRLLEDSARTRAACLTYMQNWLHYFYPECPLIIYELKEIAAEMGGTLEYPRLRSKYSWLEPVVGFTRAKRLQDDLPQMKASAIRQYENITLHKKAASLEAAIILSWLATAIYLLTRRH